MCETPNRSFAVAARYAILLLCACTRAQNPLHLTLADARKLALANNPAISAARFHALAAGQATLEARSVYQPTLTGSVTGAQADSGSRIAAGFLNNPVLYSRLGTGLSFNQLITDLGRTSSLVESARLHAQAQDQTTIATRAQILVETDRAYFAVQRSQAVLQVAQQTVANRQLLADQVGEMAKSKLRSLLDVSFANVNLAGAKLLLANAQNDVRAAQAQLAMVFGAPAQTSLALTDEPVPDAPPADVAPLLQTALQNRPELANLRLEKDAAQRFVQAERALSLPTLALSGVAGFAPTGDPQIPGRYGAIGVNLGCAT